MIERYDLLVIGGDAAGMSAASQARRINEAMTIAVLEKGSHVSYAACGMPYYIAGDVTAPEKLVAIDIDDFIKNRRISIFTGTEATALDFSDKTVSVRGPAGERTLSYGTLVIATGARPVAPPIPGIDHENIFFLRNLADGIAIKKYIASERPGAGIIIGGGFIGLEMAESLRKLSIETAILEKFDSVAMSMSPEVRNIISKTLAENGVRIITGVDISSIKRPEGRLAVHTSAGILDADFILVSVGIVPNTDFLKGPGIRMTERGAIIVDERSLTSIPGVYAAGDCATVKNLITGGDVYMPLGTTANKQGRVAGLQAAGVSGETFRGVVGSQMVKVFDLEVGKTGLNRADAERAGIQAESSSITWKSKAGYYPSSKDIFVSLTIDKNTGVLIGGEVAGTDGAALRVNVIAAAVTAGMKIEDVAYLDLGYAPPFSPVWDPVVAAAQKLSRRGAN